MYDLFLPPCTLHVQLQMQLSIKGIKPACWQHKQQLKALPLPDLKVTIRMDKICHGWHCQDEDSANTACALFVQD